MTTFPDRMGSDGISGGVGDASGPGASSLRSPEPADGLRHSVTPPIAAVLNAMRGEYDDFGGYRCFADISYDADVPFADVRRIVRDLAARGLAVFARGLFNEDGRPYGSGYALTAQGIEARRAETQRGSVEDESPLPEGNAP